MLLGSFFQAFYFSCFRADPFEVDPLPKTFYYPSQQKVLPDKQRKVNFFLTSIFIFQASSGIYRSKNFALNLLYIHVLL